MDLWTEYEGRTIDGAFLLTKLIQPEGRSAFFSTPNGTGSPTVIRLIESHFDGDEILARWRGVEALNHPNLVKLKKFGHVVVDETSLVYAVMETVDGNLAEILSERALTADETREVASSLLAAIEALHASGFVHEHVASVNVLAVGELIKLRSDCIREAPEGEEGSALKRQDVHDYSVVLLEALTQRKTLDRPLPAPFDEIVREGMSGEWGLAQIDIALKPAVGAESAAVRPVGHAVETMETPVLRTIPAALVAAQAQQVKRVHVPVDEEPNKFPRWIPYGLGALLIVLLGWYFASGRPASSNDAAKREAAAVPVVQEPVATKTEPKAAPPVPVAKTLVAVGSKPVTDSSDTWRVIAFTYNREADAMQKVAEIAQSHPDLSPGVFTPPGRPVFVVTLGGPMSKQEAFAFSGKAKKEGMPQGIYAQNYRNRGN
jgi:eukaryotic-like serine/threonine-protein kinase